MIRMDLIRAVLDYTQNDRYMTDEEIDRREEGK